MRYRIAILSAALLVLAGACLAAAGEPPLLLRAPTPLFGIIGLVSKPK
jgi:hypothetical protein